MPRDAYYHKYANDNMRDGKYTIVMVVSGNGDPMNDPDAKFAFYTTKDKLVKDGNGDIAADYTFNVDPDPRYQGVVPVKITNGVIEMQGPTDFTMRDYESDARAGGQLKLFKAQMKLEIKADGSLSGLLGGYTPWETLHNENNDYIRELTGHMNASALWYALQREADGMPDPKTGKNTAISITYRIDAVPAFVVEPKDDKAVTVAQIFSPDAQTLASVAAEEKDNAARQATRLAGLPAAAQQTLVAKSQ